MKRILATFFFLMAVAAMLAAQPHPSVTLNWTAGVGGDPATGFHVWRSTTAGGPYTTPIGTVPVGTLTYLDTSVAVGATYYYTVTAYNSAGDSARSPEASATVPFQAPQAPVTLTAAPN